jgi:acetylornithine deacetylase/succinyl-diaminopimelate desuccinylase-like protein
MPFACSLGTILVTGYRMGIVQGRLLGQAWEQAPRVIAEITEQRWLALARELVGAGQPAAENPLDPDMPPGREEGIAKVVAGKLTELGLAVELIAKRPGRPNVIGTLAGVAPDGETLILNDHLDTYPAGDPAKWDRTGNEPFRPTLAGSSTTSRYRLDGRALRT